MLTIDIPRRTSSLPSIQPRHDELLIDEDDCSTETVLRQTSFWRYVIVFGSFCSHFVADGVLFSFGILMHMIKDDLKLELHTVGIIASLFVSLPLLAAPIASALVNKFGCRLVTMLGGLLCSAGLLFASLIGNFTGALIGIGVTCGMGLACVYVPAVVIVAHYFDENRAIAIAIAVSGTGLGNALVAQLIHQLNSHYSDWRDTTFFLAGVLFTIVGFGALFRPVEFQFSRKERCSSRRKLTDHRLPPASMTPSEKLEYFIETMDKQQATRKTHQSVSMSDSNYDKTLAHSADNIQELEELNHRENISFAKFRKHSRQYEQIIASKPSLSRFFSLPVDKQEEQLLEIYYQPISQKDIFYPGNVPKKPSDMSPLSCPNLIQSYIYEESNTIISDDDNDNDDDDDTCSTHSHKRRRVLIYQRGLSFLHTLKRMLGLQLFRDYRYFIFFLSQFLFYLFYDLIYIFPVDYGEKVLGYSKQLMTDLVTILGFGQFFGQMFFGLIANYSGVGELILYDIGALLCGLSSLLIPFVAHSYLLLRMAILLFGLSISANYVLTSIILANMCGLELLTSAYGLVLLGQGVSSLFGPVLGGLIAERYGYERSLIIAGLFMGVSGFVPLLIPLINKIRGQQSQKSERTNTTTITSDNLT